MCLLSLSVIRPDIVITFIVSFNAPA